MLMLLLVPLAGADGATTLGEYALGAVAGHGDDLVWARDDGDRTSIVKTTVMDGKTTVLTAITGNARVQDLSYDGQWVVWTDERFGNRELFAVEAATGSLLRLTESGSDEQQAVVDGGVVAWVHQGRIWLRSLPDGPIRPLDAEGVLADPDLGEGIIAWIRMDNDARRIVYRALAGGPEVEVASQPGYHPRQATIESGWVVWTASVLVDPDVPAKGIARTAVLAVNRTTGGVIELASDALGDAVASAGTVTWNEATDGEVRVRQLRLRDGAESVLATNGKVVSVTPSHAILLHGTDGFQVLEAAPWHAHGKESPGVSVAMFGALMVGVAVARRVR